jgi:GTPase
MKFTFNHKAETMSEALGVTKKELVETLEILSGIIDKVNEAIAEDIKNRKEGKRGVTASIFIQLIYNELKKVEDLSAEVVSLFLAEVLFKIN